MKNIWTKLEKKCHTIFLKNMSTFSRRTSWKKLALQILLMETLEAEIVWITISTKTRNVFFPGSIQIYMYTKNHQIEHYPRRASSREENLIAPIQIYMYTKNHQIEDYPRRASSREENLIAPTGAFYLFNKIW